GFIQNHLQLTKDEALDAGFEDGETYKAFVSVFNHSNQLVKYVESPEFVFQIINDEAPVVKVPIQAVINYGFKNYPDIFPVSNSEVIIDAFKIKSSQNVSNKLLKSNSKYRNKLTEIINGEDYVKIASVVATTSSFGQLDTIIEVPLPYFETDSVAFRIRLANGYYVDKDFKLLFLKAASEDKTANFGTLTAKTYAYSLKLNVKKEFTSYKVVKNEKGVTVSMDEGTSVSLQGSSNQTDDQKQSYTYEVGKDTVAEGIPVVLYRISKPDNIPVYEGDLTQSNPPVKSVLSDITVVALGTAQREKDSTYVTFNKLLATNNPTNEEYRILAIANLSSLLGASISNSSTSLKTVKRANFSASDFAVLTPDMNSLLTTAIVNLEGNSSLTNFVDSGKFVATPITYSLGLPEDINSEDAYYRTVNASYTILSCKPPTSHVDGRLLYEWVSDTKKVKRPLANTHFRVIVDYVDGNGKTIGKVSNSSNMQAEMIGGHWESDVYQVNETNEVIPLVDQYATMAEGLTDKDGNFSLDVINFNKKGDLGAGVLSHSEGNKKPPVNGQSLKDELEEKLSGGDVINPVDYSYNNFGGDQNSLGTKQSLGSQGLINGGSFSVGFNAATQTYELGSLKAGVGNKSANKASTWIINPSDDFYTENVHGPNPGTPEVPSGDNSYSTQSFSEFRRTFRIVIDGDNAPFYYPSKDVIEIQPFEKTSSPQLISHYVKEFKLRVKTVEENLKKEQVPVSQMQVTVFRDIDEKPANLPLGEGDGEYTYKELNSPLYNNPDGNTKKYEQVWPSQAVNEQGTTIEPLYGLLQSEYSRYFIQVSSYVNTGSKAYNAEPADIHEVKDTMLDWVNPTIPVVDQTIVLSPLISRALVVVRDNSSHQVLTSSRNTRVILSKSTNIPFWLSDLNTAPVDNYGYVELLADQAPLSNFNIGESDSIGIYFSARSDGFKTPAPSQKAPFVLHGFQTTPVISMFPTAVIKGRVVDADAVKPVGSVGIHGAQTVSIISPDGVDAYVQADSGLIDETKDQYGNFEMPIAPKAGVIVKIIPKDVAWFDTTYVLTVSDEKKQIIDLNTVKLYRRKHRLQFNITQKMPPGFVGPATPVSGASVQLGPDIVNTTANGTAKFLFENISVNNYTFIVRSPQGAGFIPKTVNVKNSESRDYQQVNIVLEKGSEITGTVKLDGKPVKNARVYIEVNNTSTQGVNTRFTFKPQSSSQPQSGLQLQGHSSSESANSTVVNSNLMVEPGSYTNAALKPTGSITDDANLVEARTDAQGKYKLQGVPVNNQKINIIATLDTTFTVSGDKQQASIVNGHAQTDLNLKSFGNAIVNKLFGFPLTVEKITPVDSTQIKVTGLVHWTESISDFALKDDNKVLRVEEVLFDLVKNDNEPAKGIVHDDAVKIPGVTSLKLSYINKYNVKLTSSARQQNFYIQQQPFNSTSLQITREGNFGKICGKMQIVDNSFNYPSSYLNFEGSEFFLALPITDSTVNNRISVATSAFSETESLQKQFQEADNYRKEIVGKMSLYRQQPAPVYYLCNKDAGPLNFKVINFDATAIPHKSFIDQSGKIHLNTQISCHISNAQPEYFSLTIPDLILDENKVYPASSAKPIVVKLEDWDLEARNWTFSTSEGGILSTKAVIRTKILDIPVGKFVLRHDMFFMDKFNLDTLTMGGGKFQLEIAEGANARLNYEYKVGSDMAPHWNFSLLGSSNTKVASLPELKGLKGYNIDLNYVEILSNNEMIVQLMQKDQKPLLHGNKVAEFEPLSIFNGPDYIGVTGLLNTKAPRMGAINLTVDWTDKDVDPKFENVKTDFEAKGFVHFQSNLQKITINSNLLTIEGRVLEQPDWTFNPLPATFIARGALFASPRYEVELKSGWVTQLSAEEPEGLTQPLSLGKGYRLEIESGGMKVENNDWSTLTYSGTMKANETKKDNVADSKVKFEVLGDVSANSDQMNIGTSTPFGSFNTCYDFNKQELRGSLQVDVPSGITLGSVIVYKGVIGTCFGKEGFYIAGGMRAFLPAGILAGIYNLGMMAGYHPITPELWGLANSCINPLVVNNCYKTNTSTLSGFYFAFDREILNKSITKDFILASGYVRALALLGGDFYVNYLDGDNWGVGADGYVHIDVGAGLSAITGTSISGGVTGDGKIGFQFGQPKENSHFYTSFGLGFEAKIEQSLVVGSISESISVDCSIKGDTNNGVSFSLSSGGNNPDCETVPEENQ
ncbi:MAG TPA: hypothetical protein PKH79_04655, partial [Prolixibacteraceae bacterium]|nr:hypothetical protein [Prolixibacteraceae bacterium]